MKLGEALSHVETFMTTEAVLSFYSNLDAIGGYHPDPAQAKWPGGSVFENEGKLIFAIVRAFYYKTVIEIGLGDGCSASHIASALKSAYDDQIAVGFKPKHKGHLTSIDRGNSGRLIPDDLRPWITIIPGDGEEWLREQKDETVDLIFEDADHSERLSYEIGMLAKSKLRPGGLLIAHDISHEGVGEDVAAGYTRAGLDYLTLLIEPSDCGLMLWRKEG